MRTCGSAHANIMRCANKIERCCWAARHQGGPELVCKPRRNLSAHRACCPCAATAGITSVNSHVVPRHSAALALCQGIAAANQHGELPQARKPRQTVRFCARARPYDRCPLHEAKPPRGGDQAACLLGALRRRRQSRRHQRRRQQRQPGNRRPGRSRRRSQLRGKGKHTGRQGGGLKSGVN